jgi:type II secretory pathway component PulF
MISAGMSYVEVFNLLKEILQIPAYTIVLEQVTEGLNKGQSIYDSLKYETNLIPTNAIVLMKVGEETANMPQALENIISIYEEDLNNLLNNLSKIIEPVMLVLIGGVIIVIATGVFGVITQIMEGIQTT